MLEKIVIAVVVLVIMAAAALWWLVLQMSEDRRMCGSCHKEFDTSKEGGFIGAEEGFYCKDCHTQHYAELHDRFQL